MQNSVISLHLSRILLLVTVSGFFQTVDALSITGGGSSGPTGQPKFSQHQTFSEQGTLLTQDIDPVFPPSTTKVSFAFMITPEQITAVGGIIDSITSTAKDILSPLNLLEGLFDLVDLTGEFVPNQIPIACSATEPTGCAELVLTPQSPITAPGVYGDISFDFSVSP